MKITFLGQGFEPESKDAVGNYISQFLTGKKFTSFIGISAFASKAGVLSFSEYIEKAKQTFKNLSLIVGIDQEGTPFEALEEINKLNINSFIFYQRESPIFHPKIYLFEGQTHTALIIGSSNFTGKGLFTNVESSLLIEFTDPDIDGRELVSKLKSYFKGLFEFNDPNLFKISSKTIQSFVDEGIVVNEEISRKRYSKDLPLKKSKTESSITIPKRKQAKIPSIFRSKSKTSQIVSEIIKDLEIPQNDEPNADNLTLLWNSGPLSERDLNIPKGSNTNATGSMYFKKGLMRHIDQRHYFRDIVFSSLNWISNPRKGSAHLENAQACFRLRVLGVDMGKYELTIHHNSSTTSATYLQNNSVTSLSWGIAKKIIAKQELLGKSAKLYKLPTSNDEFLLSID